MITVVITQDHIARGTHSCYQCPMALALNEQHPDRRGWDVDGYIAQSNHGMFCLGEDARAWIVDFDDANDHTPGPAQFVLFATDNPDA